jgi:preprotein translocase subunit SecG
MAQKLPQKRRIFLKIISHVYKKYKHAIISKDRSLFLEDYTMLYGFLLFLYVFNCLLLITIILMQKGKSSMGLGAMGGGAQMLFGGSGGQDLFQKITWVLGVIFMVGALTLSLMKSNQSKSFEYIQTNYTQNSAQ